MVQKIHTVLVIILSLSFALYLPQALWCVIELLRLGGVLPIAKLTPWDELWPYWHMAAILYHPQICYTLYTLCGAGIAITETKTPKD